MPIYGCLFTILINAEEDNIDAEPLPKDDHADDIEEKNLTNPAAEGEDCKNTEAEAGLGSGDPPLDNQTIEGRG